MNVFARFVIATDILTGNGLQKMALAAIRKGNVPAVSTVVAAGAPRSVGGSRNTPAAAHHVRVASGRRLAEFSS
jgi:hypothetical protein